MYVCIYTTIFRRDLYVWPNEISSSVEFVRAVSERVKDTFFPGTGLLKFSRIRPIYRRSAREGDLGRLPSTADYDSRRLRWLRWRSLQHELESTCFPFWPHLNNPWIHSRRACLSRRLWGKRKKRYRGNVFEIHSAQKTRPLCLRVIVSVILSHG